MKKIFLDDKDKKQIQMRNISEEEIQDQIFLIQEGVSNIILDRPCILQDGIISIPKEEQEKYLAIYEKALDSLNIIKFVPASGAASRMFEDLEKVLPLLEKRSFSDILNSLHPSEEEKNFVLFAQNIKKIAFYENIEQIFKKTDRNLEKSIDEEKWQDIIRHLLYSHGLDYAHSPKALIPFHKYEGKSYTALEEQLYEGVRYAKKRDNTARFHFTITPGQENNFCQYTQELQSIFQKENIHLLIEFSQQALSTETIALDSQNDLLREENGEILFRPGGHGALLENLNNLDADIVFIKNIDNVVPPAFLETTCLYKKLLAGYLLTLQSQVFAYLDTLEKGHTSDRILQEMIQFARNQWNIQVESSSNIKEQLFAIFHRPIRVCGMVKNQGEPGGGPFWTKDSQGKISRQIVEKSQIALKLPDQKKILESSTHFNPVDLVCSLKDHRGKKFQLKQFVDKKAVFLSQKPYRGQTIKALELPGLWNGAMAFWNTSFIEVPLATFNPVKKVTDLLRKKF